MPPARDSDPGSAKAGEVAVISAHGRADGSVVPGGTRQRTAGLVFAAAFVAVVAIAAWLLGPAEAPQDTGADETATQTQPSALSEDLDCTRQARASLTDWEGTFPTRDTPVATVEAHLAKIAASADGWAFLRVELTDFQAQLATIQPRARSREVVVFDGERAVLHVSVAPALGGGWKVFGITRCDS